MYLEKGGPVAVGGGERGSGNGNARHRSFTPPRLQVASTWHSAKALGDAAELAIAKHFTALGFTVAKTIGKADHDLSIIKRIEVKRDDVAERTGNTAIEVSYRGKPSGIHRTSASLWAIIVGSEAFIIETEQLRSLVEFGDFPEVSAGDGQRSRVVLVPVETLRWADGVQVIRLSECVGVAMPCRSEHDRHGV